MSDFRPGAPSDGIARGRIVQKSSDFEVRTA